MTVSLHFTGYRSPVRACAALNAYRRERRHGLPPGLGPAAICRTGRFSKRVSQRPTLLRWALMCCWDDPGAAGRFAAESPLLAALTEPADESWHLQLEPVRIRGAWRGWEGPGTLGKRLAADEPAVAMISGLVPPRLLPRFVRSNARVVSQLDGDPDAIVSLALHDTALTMTSFSIWRTTDAMNRFAYGAGTTHRRVMDATPDFDNRFFARFRPIASSGTWRGRDPLPHVGGPQLHRRAGP